MINWSKLEEAFNLLYEGGIELESLVMTQDSWEKFKLSILSPRKNPPIAPKEPTEGLFMTNYGPIRLYSPETPAKEKV